MKNYVITGSLGNISHLIVQSLVKEGHHVSVISSKSDNQSKIEALGAKALIGDVSNTVFIENAFEGADAVYLMIPPNWGTTDWLAYQKTVADNYVYAIQKNNIKYVVQLSSIGAHMRNGAGPIDGLAYLETELEKLKDISTKALRPSYFFYNLFGMKDMIKNAGIMGSNFGGEEKIALVHTSDIAELAVKYLKDLSFQNFSSEYIASDEKTSHEIAAALSKAANKPNTPWIIFSDEDALNGMKQIGLSNTIAEGYTQLGKSLREGKIQADYWKNRPQQLGKVKLEDFAKEFEAIFHSQS
jgi:uncharacterized protein YbjT (DUF2867 family)